MCSTTIKKISVGVPARLIIIFQNEGNCIGPYTFVCIAISNSELMKKY
jgi:hypothetical protein